jgi:predicted small lipoprotein YifL
MVIGHPFAMEAYIALVKSLYCVLYNGMERILNMAGKIITGCLILALLAGCGNKGDLYLPDAEPARIIPPQQDTSHH